MILSCDYGKIAVTPNRTKFGFFEKTKPITKLMFQIDDSCTNYTNVMISLQPCIGTNFCEINLRRNWLKSQKECLDMVETHKLVLSTFCKNIELEIPKLPFMRAEKGSILLSYNWNFLLGTLMISFYFYYLLV